MPKNFLESTNDISILSILTDSLFLLPNTIRLVLVTMSESLLAQNQFVNWLISICNSNMALPMSE